MATRRTRVVVTRRLPEVVEARLCELFDTVLNPEDRPRSVTELAQIAASSDVMVSTVTDQLSERVFAGELRLRMVAQFGVGVDNIDLDAAHARGVVVTNTPGVLTDDTADMAMALILSCPRRLREGVGILESGQFRGWSPTWMLGRRISGMRLGILGLGRIGQAVARRALAFGMEIHYHSRRPVPERVRKQTGAVYWSDLDQMLGSVDILTIHCPGNLSSYHLLDRRRLGLMKSDAYIVNVARGQVIDEEALIDVLESGHLAGAGLDVYENEPDIDPRLKGLKNVTLLPHMGSATLEARIEMGNKVAVNIRTFIDGHRPPDRVVTGMFEAGSVAAAG